MSNTDIHESLSAYTFEATLERLTAAITQAGLTLFSRIDHHAGAHDVGLSMPPTTVLTYGNPKGGTPIMLASPLTALDLPLRVLVRVRGDGQTAIAFHPIDATLRQAGVPSTLADKLNPAQQLLLKAVSP
ncbi:DUF302 domain-containing protein [Acidocella aminolytica]|jgi:uncharacterized protein (DUF302 family)|uniref:DUF302 domain-containing protein n=1 Tax=Acidocella aminolytica 101 = DSM 11237 TaxID=1120923 RepID=A0A0D6PJH0_9PROT|nr:DUF302 domain-containing protein [Acidocella aminolytica]GAN81566.1 hypothetical protein Aam_103_010 [Acidocella aminolytica 101 = DSM 11237]GBQ36016.1 hypothetical protein AA11237_1122 [Acidocella aminolytica 101 = DSM 11237]SHF47888.1 Uncharacterized conserved protein, DUF302 family [Acidocella aminolytica 101 = DSM 11237]